MYANKGDVPEYIQEARQHNDPNKLTEAQQQDVFFANLYQQQGTDDFFKIIKTMTKENIFIISHKGDIMFDKFTNIVKFEKYKNFTRLQRA